MRDILKIFKSDLKGLYKNIFALIIVIGLCALPALYAWLNIYANWDPYSNTGNIKILVANEDNGYTDPTGDSWTMGDDIVAQLKEKTNIGWCFTDNSDEVIEGVSSGEYYAGIVIGEDFSESVYNGTDEDSNPHITYYLNDKKNAVATKITDTAASSVQTSLNQIYIKTISKKLFRYIGVETDTIKTDSTSIGNQFDENLSALIKKLKKIQSNIDSLMEASNNLGDDLINSSSELNDQKASLQGTISEISSTKNNIANAQTNLNSISESISALMTKINSGITSLQTTINSLSFDESIKTTKSILNKLKKKATSLNDSVETLLNLLEDLKETGLVPDDAIKELSSLKDLTSSLAAGTGLSFDSTALNSASDSINSIINTLSNGITTLTTTYNGTILPQLNTLLQNLSDQATSLENILNSVIDVFDSSDTVLSSAGTTINAFDNSLTSLKKTIKKVTKKLKTLQKDYRKLADDDKLDFISKFVSGDEDAIADYFSDPVTVETTKVYEVENYGSGVAPFYTTLAIWVGMTILVSLLKVHPSDEEFLKLKPHKQFFGKYQLFFVISEVQTLIIVLGDLLIFKIQCLYPVTFCLVACAASFVFSLLIYSLTVSFGDLGKAIAVIIMVMQIAGSSGTYPIEALPSFFKNVYMFFPFPYVINSMRECIGGLYEYTLLSNMLMLGFFVIAALLIGLFLRIPFIKLLHFIEERLHDTKLM